MNTARPYRCARGIMVVIPLAMAVAAHGHPLGNDNIEHVSVLWVMPDRLEVDFLLFIAETQSMLFQREEIDANKDGADDADEQQAWLKKKAAEFASYLHAEIDGQTFPLRPVADKVDPETGRKTVTKVIIKVPGFAEMPTYHLIVRYAGGYPSPLSDGKHTIHYEDATFPQDSGLKRILLEPMPEFEFFPPHPEFYGPEVNPFRFEQYDPADLPQEREATITFRQSKTPVVPASAPASAPTRPVPPPVVASAPASAPAVAETRPTGEKRIASVEEESASIEKFRQAGVGDPENVPKNKYQQQADRVIAMLRGEWGLLTLITVTALSFGWGAAHALMPGHAKTVVAAYLISQHGTYRHAVVLAIIVTLTHTALVVILGLVWAYYKATHPELGPRLQLWLGLLSGFLVAGMGLTLVWRGASGRLAHHHRDRDHRHHHHDDDRSWLRKLFTHSHPDLPAHAHENDHPHTHHHHDHGHDHAPGHAPEPAHTHAHDHEKAPASVERDQQLTFRLLVVLGVTGGIVPCPTATIIMLLGVGADVVLGALYAVSIFSLGLALTLMLIGFLALSSRRFAARLMSDAEHEGELSGHGQWILLRAIPALSGLAVVTLGGLIAANYVYRIETGRALFGWMG